MPSHCCQVMDKKCISTTSPKVTNHITVCLCVQCVCHSFVVDSNDSLYGGDKKFIGEISRIADTIINLLLEHLKELSSTEEVGADFAVIARPIDCCGCFVFTFHYAINCPSIP